VLIKVKLKLPFSELIIALKVIIDLTNHFRSAEYGAVTMAAIRPYYNQKNSITKINCFIMNAYNIYFTLYATYQTENQHKNKHDITV